LGILLVDCCKLREPYAIDMRAVIEKAGRVGVAIELNADPHRVDIDWRLCKLAMELGTNRFDRTGRAPRRKDSRTSHSALPTARKGWLSASNVLNARKAQSVLEFARARRVTAALA
jgi:DNA polymerase (family 10)